MLGWQPPRSGLVLSPIKLNGDLILFILFFLIYLNFTPKAESFVYTICGVLKSFQKESPTRYSSHHRLDADYQTLLLEVVVQFQILLVGVYTIYKR